MQANLCQQERDVDCVNGTNGAAKPCDNVDTVAKILAPFRTELKRTDFAESSSRRMKKWVRRCCMHKCVIQ